MATTTSNFSWPIPQSTDLVKDGATAIASLGSGIDTSMAELKGGTTGQILSKTSGTDMDFTWITPNPGDITGVTAGAGLTGGGTSGDVTLAVNSLAAGRNLIINGGFDIWQRGTSVSLAASTAANSAFTADRWQYPTGTNQACTVSRQATGDTTNLPNIQYCARVQRNSGQTGTAAINFGMNIETANSIPLAGKTVVFSLYARAGANYSATSNALGINLVYGTGTDQSVWSGLTGQTNIINQTATLTTTWQRFSYSVAVPASATQFALYIQNTPTGTAGAADYYEITGVQLELGSSATPFSRAGGTIQGELAACQRYYTRFQGDIYEVVAPVTQGYSTTQTIGSIPMPVTLRIGNPTIDYSGIIVSPVGGGATTVTSVAVNRNGKNFINLVFGVASGLTVGTIYTVLCNGSSSNYLGVSAEL